ncbi:MAG: Hemerythrin HHE cation binding domain [Rhodobacteraceae bacterium HLUCCA12]|nr:MAG: Hemerythrin HHE cation binding domain [Rhodobacteraceae bacterium HLUCCA12]
MQGGAMNDDTLENRSGLPDALRILLEKYPRDLWKNHSNFDGLTRFWLERHLMFRQVLGQLQGESQAFLNGDADPQTHASRTARMAGFLIEQLHGHHQIEDHHYFPQLAAAETRLERGFEILDSDHHALDGHLRALADDTNAMLRAIAEGQDARLPAGALEQRLGRFHHFIDRHLTDEEDLVVPVILHHGFRL